MVWLQKNLVEPERGVEAHFSQAGCSPDLQLTPEGSVPKTSGFLSIWIAQALANPLSHIYLFTYCYGLTASL